MPKSGRLTSEDQPLEVSCLALPPPRGLSQKRMVGFCMALGRNKQKEGYSWARDLAEDIRRLKSDYKADIIVTMMPLAELDEIGASDLPEAVRREGLEWEHFPIVDKYVPEQGIHCFLAQAKVLAQRMQQGKRVVVHCNGGKGRSATMAAAMAYLYTQLTDGVTPWSMPKAIAKTRGTCKGSLKNPLQLGYLGACSLAAP